MSVPTNLVNLYAHAQSSSNGGFTTVFTHGSSLKNPDGTLGYGGILDRMVVYNADTIAHGIVVYRVPSSSSVSLSYVIDRLTLPTLAAYIIEGPFYSASTDFYQGALTEAPSSSINGVFYQAFYHEMS